MEKLTEKELKSIASQRAFKANRTLVKGAICGGCLLPFVVLDMWLIYAEYITDIWGYVIFAVIMLTLWTANHLIRRRESRITTEVLKELKESYGL